MVRTPAAQAGEGAKWPKFQQVLIEADPLDLFAALFDFLEVNSDDDPTLSSRFGIRRARSFSSKSGMR